MAATPRRVAAPVRVGATVPAWQARLDGAGERVLADQCQWMDANGALFTPRHGH